MIKEETQAFDVLRTQLPASLAQSQSFKRKEQLLLCMLGICWHVPSWQESAVDRYGQITDGIIQICGFKTVKRCPDKVEANKLVHMYWPCNPELLSEFFGSAEIENILSFR